MTPFYFLAKLKNNSTFLAKLDITPYFWQNLTYFHNFGKTSQNFAQLHKFGKTKT